MTVIDKSRIIIEMCQGSVTCADEAVASVQLLDERGAVLVQNFCACRSHIEKMQAQLAKRPADWPKYTLDVKPLSIRAN